MIRLIEDLKKSIRLVIGKCLIEVAKKDADGLSADILLLGNERHSGVRLMQHYGFASRPDSGAKAVALFVGGSRDNGVVVATQGAPSGIPDLDDGEVAVFSRYGQKILLDKDGNVQVIPASGKDVIFEGRVVAKDDIISESNILSVGEVAAKVTKIGESYSEVVAVHLSTHVHAGQGVSPTPGT